MLIKKPCRLLRCRVFNQGGLKQVAQDPPIPVTPVATAVMGTVTSTLSALPSFTTKLATYTPMVLAVKVGLAAVAEDKVAVLPVGLVVSTHL